MTGPIGVGVDVGSSGIRVLAAGADGKIHGSARVGWALQREPDGIHEQDPEMWWAEIKGLLTAVCEQLTAVERAAVSGVSVTATSGTVVVADANLKALRPAMMWDDKRAVEEAEVCADVGAELSAELGYRFRPTFSLPKMLWIQRQEPAVWKRVRYSAHRPALLAPRRTNQAPRFDNTNSFKSGYDLLRFGWPDYLETLGIDRGLLPRVVPAGTTVGTVSREVADVTGLPYTTRVVAGMTDANTAQVASGAYELGQWVTTIGTGLSLKGVSRNPVRDPRGVLYNHRHPDGYWIPSGTSHSGADAITARFGGADLDQLTAEAAQRPPAAALVFPLARRGEFFPIWAPQASGFVVGEVADDAAMFRGCLEGIAYIERLSHEVATALGADIVGPVTTMGGGSRSPLWQQIRADVLDRPVRATLNLETALGAVIVALAEECGGIPELARTAVQHTNPVEPRPIEREIYAGGYERFLEELVRRGYLDRGVLLPQP